MLLVLIEILLLATLGTLIGLLMRVTFPDCTNTHCTEHHLGDRIK